MRIVRLANFVTPTSGGLRTALRRLGEGYAAAGHEPILIVPGPSYSDSLAEQGRVIQLPGARVPGLGGYRVLLDRKALRRMLYLLRPHRLEVSDRTTLRWTGAWARRHRVPSVMVSHESLAGLLRVARLPAALAAPLNRATARAYDRIVCTTEWAAREFETEVSLVPLGVDLDLFKPRARTGNGLLLVCCTRLSVEKRPQRALITLRSLLSQGINARLVIAGDGPLRTRLEREAHGLPVTFTGWIADRTELAQLLAGADIALAPGPIETFGLAALEALASGTPVVASASSALPGVIGDEAGACVAGEDLSGGVLRLLAVPQEVRRKAARARAEQFGWDAAVKGFLRVHEEIGDAHRGPR